MNSDQIASQIADSSESDEFAKKLRHYIGNIESWSLMNIMPRLILIEANRLEELLKTGEKEFVKKLEENNESLLSQFSNQGPVTRAKMSSTCGTCNACVSHLSNCTTPSQNYKYFQIILTNKKLIFFFKILQCRLCTKLFRQFLSLIKSFTNYITLWICNINIKDFLITISIIFSM